MLISRVSRLVSWSVACFLFTPAFARNSDALLPPYILHAQTVAVLIDPDAGVDLRNPNANQTAQQDVEAALQKWGRFEVVLDPEIADMIVVVRKGHGKLVAETTGDPRQNSRPGSVIQTPGAITIGGQRGTQRSQPDSMPGSGGQGGPGDVGPQAEIGAVNDSFAVYEGKSSGPTSGAYGWRWNHKDALHSHDVPAVEEFRKAIAAAEKQAAQQQSKHP